MASSLQRSASIGNMLRTPEDVADLGRHICALSRGMKASRLIYQACLS
ncbi:MAG: hypothetical protein HEQ19_26255 [Gloeotrichia echinulata CP02]